MYLCYADESGVPSIPGNTSHYILAGISIPSVYWKKCDIEINQLKTKWHLENTEVHTAWMLRKYLEQNKIKDFDTLSYSARLRAITKIRNTEILRLQATNPKKYHQLKKDYQKTNPYVHLAFDERKFFLIEMSEVIGNWDFARLFAECIDKIYFDPTMTTQLVDEQAFEQVVSRFEHYLQIMASIRDKEESIGIIIHDNNDTVCKRLTELMNRFHKKGTLWTKIKRIIETPLFVDSSLTSMVQVADLCGYSIRRYLENNETFLFNNIFKRADRKDGKVVGVRHYSEKNCNCTICS